MPQRKTQSPPLFWVKLTGGERNVMRLLIAVGEGRGRECGCDISAPLAGQRRGAVFVSRRVGQKPATILVNNYCQAVFVRPNAGPMAPGGDQVG